MYEPKGVGAILIQITKGGKTTEIGIKTRRKEEKLRN